MANATVANLAVVSDDFPCVQQKHLVNLCQCHTNTDMIAAFGWRQYNREQLHIFKLQKMLLHPCSTLGVDPPAFESCDAAASPYTCVVKHGNRVIVEKQVCQVPLELRQTWRRRGLRDPTGRP